MNVRVPGSFVMVLLGCTGCVSSPATEDHDILNSEFPAARAEIETKMRTMDELVNTLDELRDLHLDSPKFSKLGDNAPRKGFEEMIADHHALVRVWKEARDMVYNLINCSKPVVSAMHGPAVGAGLAGA